MGKGSVMDPPMVASSMNRTIRFAKQELREASILMGKAHRSAITGEITLLDTSGFPDFQVVDLAKRPVLVGSTESLMKDKYLFKAYPLMYRTWMYHSLVNSATVLSGSYDEHQMVQHVFAQSCIDAPTNGGRASPIPYFVPLAIGTCLTGNMFLAMATLVIIAIILFVFKASNTPIHYRKARYWTSPLRVGYAGLVLALVDFSDFLAMVGFLVTLGTLAADFITGDLAALYSYRFHCYYDVLKFLPGRLAVCHRRGAFQWEDFFGKRGCVHECVSSLGIWEKYHHLICDIGDLLVELRPLDENDWLAIRDQYYYHGDGIPYMALDIFDMDDLGSTAASMSSISPTRVQDMFLEDF